MASKEEVEKRKRKRNKEKKEKKDKKKRKTISSTMAAAEEEEKRKRKRKKEKKEKGKRKRKRERKRSYSSSSDSSDSSDSVECAHCSRENKKYGKKRKPSDVGDQPLLTDDEMGVKGLKAWNKKQLKSGGTQYEFVRILYRFACMRFLEGWTYHVNFEAKPVSSSDAQMELFFAELKRNACDTHVTLCCPVQKTDPFGAGMGSGSTDESCGGSADAPVASSAGGAMGGSADALVCDSASASEVGLGDASGGLGSGGSNDAFACDSGDRLSGCSDESSEEDSSEDDSSEDDGSEDDSSADDEILNCCFCPPVLIHPRRGYDVGLRPYRIPVKDIPARLYS